jgi:hypothetical protein
MKLQRSSLLPLLASAAGLTLTACTATPLQVVAGPPVQGNAATHLYLPQNTPNGSSAAPQILLFPTGVSGNPAPSSSITLPAGLTLGPIAVDASGNIYIATSSDIREYAASATGAAIPARLIPFNATTTLVAVTALAADPAGNIYAVNQGTSIAIFSSYATGTVAPTRSLPFGGLTTIVYPESIAVNPSGNLYVANVTTTNQSSVLIFGPSANGNVAPSSTLNQFAMELGTDSAGDLYALEFNGASEILEFAAGASGNANPVRTLSLGQDALTGFAVGPAGDLYAGTNGTVLNNLRSSTPTFLEFSSSASGSATAAYSFSATDYAGAGLTSMAAY